jgi:hypothetical protein
MIVVSLEFEGSLVKIPLHHYIKGACYDIHGFSLRNR